MNVIRILSNQGASEGLLQWRVSQEGDEGWVGICDAMRLTATGETWGELTEAINDMLDHLFRDLFKTGELDRFLRARGWTPIGMRPELTPDQVVFDLPWTPVRYASLRFWTPKGWVGWEPHWGNGRFELRSVARSTLMRLKRRPRR